MNLISRPRNLRSITILCYLALFSTLITDLSYGKPIDKLQENLDAMEVVVSEGSKQNDKRQLQIEPPHAAMVFIDRQRNELVNIYPGILDETLLSKGSFAFGSKLVKFDKLKVLGNVYVNKINGRTLRETYLLRKGPTTINRQALS